MKPEHEPRELLPDSGIPIDKSAKRRIDFIVDKCRKSMTPIWDKEGISEESRNDLSYLLEKAMVRLYEEKIIEERNK